MKAFYNKVLNWFRPLPPHTYYEIAYMPVASVSYNGKKRKY